MFQPLNHVLSLSGIYKSEDWTAIAQNISLGWRNNERDGVSITSITIVYWASTIYSGADQRKHQSSASLAFVRRIHWWPMNSPHKGPVMWKMVPFDDVIMLLIRLICKLWSDDAIWDPVYQHGLTLRPVLISNYIHWRLWYVITYPNSNGCAVKIREWISNFMPHITGHVITYQCWN